MDGSGTVSLTTSMQASSEREAAPIEQEFNHLTNSVDRLTTLLDALEDRLNPICGDGLNLDSPSPAVADQRIAPFGEAIRDVRTRIANNNNRISRLLDRIEL